MKQLSGAKGTSIALFGKEQITFDWAMGEEIYQHARRSPQTSTSLRTGTMRRLRVGFLRGLILVLVVLMSITSGSFPLEKLHHERANRLIGGTIAYEIALWQAGGPHFTGDLSGPESKITFTENLLDPEADARWQRRTKGQWITQLRSENFQPASQELQSVELHGEIAIAQTVVTPPSGVQWPSYPTTQYRFYRQRDGAWVQTFPSKPFWGDAKVLETEHLILNFHTLDASVVEAIAPRLEATYERLLHLTDANSGSQTSKMNIQFSVDLYPDLRLARYQGTVPAYLLAWRSASTPPEEGLLFATTQMLAASFVMDMQGSYKTAFPLMNGFMFSSLQDWLTEETTGLASPWQAQSAQFLADYLQKHGAIPLNQETEALKSLPQPDTWRAMSLAGKHLVEYALLTHGTDTFPELVRNLAAHSTWDTMIRETFGVPPENFEAGWNQFMREQ